MLNAVRALSGGGSARLFVRSRPEPSQVGVGHGPAESAAHTMRTVKPAALFINDCLHIGGLFHSGVFIASAIRHCEDSIITPAGAKLCVNVGACCNSCQRLRRDSLVTITPRKERSSLLFFRLSLHAAESRLRWAALLPMPLPARRRPPGT
jgi:hypothetical protein